MKKVFALCLLAAITTMCLPPPATAAARSVATKNSPSFATEQPLLHVTVTYTGHHAVPPLLVKQPMISTAKAEFVPVLPPSDNGNSVAVTKRSGNEVTSEVSTMRDVGGPPNTGNINNVSTVSNDQGQIQQQHYNRNGNQSPPQVAINSCTNNITTLTDTACIDDDSACTT